MHEMSLAQGVVDAIAAEANRQNFARVEKVILEVGTLSCVDTHALEFSFEAVVKDTLADGAELEIQTPPGQGHCFGCDQDVAISRLGDSCPLCGSHQVLPTGGDELKIKALEVV